MLKKKSRRTTGKYTRKLSRSSTNKRRSLEKSRRKRRSPSQKEKRRSSPQKKRQKERSKRRSPRQKERTLPLNILKIYGLNPGNKKHVEIINRDTEKWFVQKKKMLRWLEDLVYDDDFQEAVFDENLTKKEMTHILSASLNCVDRLVDTIVLERCEGNLNYSKLQEIYCVSIGIAIKLVGAYDWICDKGLMTILIDLCCDADDGDQKKCKKNMFAMEKDILTHTNWKPCKNVF